MEHFLKRHSLIIGLALMFLYTWPIDLANSDVFPIRVPFAIYITLGWGFIFVSLLMTSLTLGKDAAIGLLKRFLIWRVGWEWYLVAFLTGGSLLLTTLFHTSGNTAGAFLPMANTVSGDNMNVLVIAIALEILIAAGIVTFTGAERFSLRLPAQKQKMEAQV